MKNTSPFITFCLLSLLACNVLATSTKNAQAMLQLASISTTAEAVKALQNEGLAILEQLARENRLDADQKNTWLPAFRNALARY